VSEKNILEPRLRTPPPDASAYRITGRLPDDVLDEQVQRFGVFTAVAAGLWMFALVMDTLVTPHTVGTTASRLSVAIEIVAALASLSAFFYVRYAGHCAQTKSDAGLWFMLLNAIAVALIGTRNLPNINLSDHLSWNTIVILGDIDDHADDAGEDVRGVDGRGIDRSTGGLIAHLRGVDVPSALNTPVLFLPNYACVVATVPPYALRRIGRRLREAQELGSYQLVEMLGRGGMGEVWRAKHRLLARPAAIKLVRPEVLGASTDLEAKATLRRFEREAQATAALSSPHTIRVFDFGATHDGAFYYVMELLSGRDLDSLVREFGPLPADRAIYLLRQVCHSLADAHARGMVHRDIKPANIYVCRKGLDYDFVKVLDFGLVKVSGSGSLQQTATIDHTTSGTPAFMAPEIILGDRDVDRRADVYALGCVAYYLLTGELVFDADTPMKMLLHHVQTPPIPPSQRTELPISKELDEPVLACLEGSQPPPQDAGQLFDGSPALSEGWTGRRTLVGNDPLELTGPLTLIEDAPESGRSRQLSTNEETFMRVFAPPLAQVDDKTSLDRTLSLFTDVHAGEGTTAILMLLNVFLLLICYSVIKTAREPLILLGGGAEVRSYTAAGQALVLMGFVPLYSWFASRVDRIKLLVGVSLFFVFNIELFALAVAAGMPYVGVAFFIWVGVFNMSLVAQFWAYANDIYSKEAGDRLFPMIVIGQTAGAPLGAFVAGRLFRNGFTPQAILQISAVLLTVGVLLYLMINARVTPRTRSRDQPLAIGGGFGLVLKSRYLLPIAAMMILLNAVNTTGEYFVSHLATDHAHALAAADPGFNAQAYLGRSSATISSG
jgi:serine/threonine protein kinase